MMTNMMLTQQMKGYTVIAALKVVYLEFACFLNVAQSFIVKGCKELEVNDGDTTAVSKHITPASNRQILV